MSRGSGARHQEPSLGLSCGPETSAHAGGAAPLEHVVLNGIASGGGARGDAQLAIEGGGMAVDWWWLASARDWSGWQGKDVGLHR
jgi:hypothetical protein